MTTTATPRARPSVPTSTSARPSASSITTAPRQTFDLPPYQSLLFPLNPTAVRAIQNIPRIHDLTRLNERLATSSQVLSNTAAEINDRYQHRRAQLEREKARAREKDVAVENVDERQERLEIMKCEVEDMTEKMEQGVRGVIDARAEVEVSERVTGELGGRAGEGGSLQTQSTLGASQSQFRRAKRRIVTDDERDEEEDEDGETGARGSGEGVVGIWKKKIGDEGRVYEGLSMMARCVLLPRVSSLSISESVLCCLVICLYPVVGIQGYIRLSADCRLPSYLDTLLTTTTLASNVSFMMPNTQVLMPLPSHILLPGFRDPFPPNPLKTTHQRGKASMPTTTMTSPMSRSPLKG